MAAAYDDPAERTAALTALASINSFHRARRKLEPQVIVTQGRKRYVRLSLSSSVTDAHSLPHAISADSVIDSLERGQRQVEKERIRVSMQMDDRQFQGALVDSQVRNPSTIHLFFAHMSIQFAGDVHKGSDQVELRHLNGRH